MPFTVKRPPRRRAPIARSAGAAVLVMLLLVACGGGNNRPAASPTRAASAAPAGTVSATRAAATPAPTASVQAATPSETPLTAACAVPSATRTPATLQPLGTANPVLAGVVQKLAPLLLQTSDLPPAMRDFVTGGPVATSNQDYVSNQPNADCLARVLDQIGRQGGAQASWSKAGTYQRGQHTPLALIDSCSQFASPDGARQGVAFVFSQTNNPPKTNPTDQISVSPIEAGAYGDETRAVRVDDRENVLANSPTGTPSPVNVRQTFFNVTWRRGTVVCSVQSSSLDEDPSLADLKSLAQLQDQRLKQAGY